MNSYSRRIFMNIGAGLLALGMVQTTGFAQDWNVGGRAADRISAETKGKLKLTFEWRFRFEDHTGQGFGKDPDLATGLMRTRVGMSYIPVKWLKFSGMMQDSRAPLYGDNAPNTARDTADLHESYIELFPDRKTGFGMTVGRMMLNYGEGRLIGTPQWGNLARTYDHVRLYYCLPKARFEFLMVAPVKVRTGEFNQPVPGDRVWGGYLTFRDVLRTSQMDFYVLRRDQNRPGGFTGGSERSGTDSLGIETFGARITGPLARDVKYGIEGAWQTGSVGPAGLRAGAWYSSLSRRWTVASRPFDLSAEYKYASGTTNPQDTTRTRTFDQLYPANHDKFGHEDLFGWRNIHNARSVATYEIRKNFALNAMYNNYWLASLRDSLYNGSGKSIALSPMGTAGRHVGQEADIFATYKRGCLQFGAGYGHLFAGEFIRKTTPGASPAYVYVFQTYTF